VPWCAHCNKFLTPSTVQPDATCPKCGQVVEKGLIPGMTRPADAAPATGIPWHLKLLLIAFAIYLSWRFFQMLSWVL
jgi:PHP family Zn ribbon phosphoesterase